MSDDAKVMVRVSVLSVIGACIGAALAIGAVVLAEGHDRGVKDTEIRSLKEWRIEAGEKIKVMDDRINRIDSNVQWIRGALGGSKGE